MTNVKKGDKVAWNSGGGAPGGTASEVVTDGDAKMVSHRGNEVKKKGSPEDPAVHIERPGNDVVKKSSELELEEDGSKHKGGESKEDNKKGEGGEEAGEKEKDDGEETNAQAKTGEKRSADEANKDDQEKKDEAAAPKESGEAAQQQPPKKKGRPAKSGGGAAKKETKMKETKKKEPKNAAGEPRRSGRNKS